MIEAYIQFEKGLIIDEGEVTNADTAKFLRNYMTELLGFITRCYMVLPRNVDTLAPYPSDNDPKLPN